ncbi:6-phosphogluconolactonase [Aestuariimicrobium ganziense]|uniref:6-phosphogluconolactonase n=1 Tax=Aestuariimicrobium ganziense TaxID=2773677 RepID=UPI001944A937|nr:6-phosphogluconolactonase [Aestuariimicrobium ganziense]
MQPSVFGSPEAMGEAAAELVLDRWTTGAAGRFVLGCPGGRSAVPVYRALASRAALDRLDLSGWVIVMMDEYVTLDSDGTPGVVDEHLPHSCRGFALRDIVAVLNADLPDEHCIRVDNVVLPSPDDPSAYDRLLTDLGGIDVFLLASGASDGHVAFNVPGTPRDRRTHLVQLPESTRRDNLSTFPSFGGDLSAVPTHGITVGVATIAEQSRAAVMVAHGADKQLAVQRITAADHYDSDWPATIVTECRDPHFLVDQASSSPL